MYPIPIADRIFPHALWSRLEHVVRDDIYMETLNPIIRDLFWGSEANRLRLAGTLNPTLW
jgi:hypothetical protein